MSDEVIVTIIGLALIAFVLWFFLTSTKSGTNSPQEHHDH
jgi:plastocyanin domain-containing protein